MSFICRIKDTWHNLRDSSYEALQKKEDDCIIQKTESWREEFPINPQIRKCNYLEIEKYARGVMAGLKQVPITSSNFDLIRVHLVDMAEMSDLLRQDLIKKMKSLKGNKELITQLTNKLIMTCERTFTPIGPSQM